jgi:hypothetical protein
MLLKECIELNDSIDVENTVEKHVRYVGAKGLKIDRAIELGLFERIAHLLCGMQTLVNTAYRLYGEVDMWLSNAGAKKHEIKRVCSEFERACDVWFRYWKEYNTRESTIDMNDDAETLEKHFMHWAQLPECWHLGDSQRVDDSTTTAIHIDIGDNTYTFHKSVVESHVDDEMEESWCVTKYDIVSKQQTTVNTDMDKASALMVAKRLSDNDAVNIYTASMARKIVEHRTEVIPFKAFKGNETIGKIKKVLK